jgi:hypothetical protein
MVAGSCPSLLFFRFFQHLSADQISLTEIRVKPETQLLPSVGFCDRRLDGRAIKDVIALSEPLHNSGLQGLDLLKCSYEIGFAAHIRPLAFRAFFSTVFRSSSLSA